jgi:hypothetical protein
MTRLTGRRRMGERYRSCIYKVSVLKGLMSEADAKYPLDCADFLKRAAVRIAPGFTNMQRRLNSMRGALQSGTRHGIRKGPA